MLWYFSEEISQRSKCRAERMGNVRPENQISLEDRVCISFVSFCFTFYSNFWNALFLFSPKWCSGRLVGVMLDKPAFVAPPQIGFVWQSNLISSLTRATQFRSIESNSIWPAFIVLKTLMSVMFETKMNDPFENDENDAKKRCQPITQRQITPNCLGQKKTVSSFKFVHLENSCSTLLPFKFTKRFLNFPKPGKLCWVERYFKSHPDDKL